MSQRWYHRTLPGDVRFVFDLIDYVGRSECDMAYFSAPRFLLSTVSSPLLSGNAYLQVGGKAPLCGVDLADYGSFRSKLQRWDSVSADHTDRIRSIWVPSDHPLLLDDELQSIGPVFFGYGPRPTLVVDRPLRRSRDDLANQITTAIHLRQTAGDFCRIAVAIGPYYQNSARAHLSALAGLRMQASEWDIDIALDLSHGVDWLWEAEAAVYRIMPSLQLIRISTGASTLDGRFRSSLTDRALTSCAELGFDGMISLVVPVPWWHWRNEHTIEAFCRDATGRIIRRFARVSSTGEFPSELSAPVEFE